MGNNPVLSLFCSHCSSFEHWDIVHLGPIPFSMLPTPQRLTSGPSSSGNLPVPSLESTTSPGSPAPFSGWWYLETMIWSSMCSVLLGCHFVSRQSKEMLVCMCSHMPDLRGRHSVLAGLWSLRFCLDKRPQAKKLPLITERFYHEWMLDLMECFLYIYWDD